ncbi:MAG: transposase family protein, partial [Candidatus Omnitrophica bacterium]|nr:transposase family protein [Candidatus Omnitrophota bacterium]
MKEAPPFSVIGMDFAGPVYCSDFPNQKHYILIFTCAVVRAVHLELTESMNVDDFILALRRFVSRRGLPSAIFSDNAKTFIAVSDRLLAFLGPNCPKFIRINPLSPWWGGWWERLVKSVKSALKKSIGKYIMRRKEVETHLV